MSVRRFFTGDIEIVSHSELTCFRRCPTEWRFRYVLKREKVGPKAQALAKGTAAHRVIGAFHRGEDPDLSGLAPELRALVKGYRAYWGKPDRQFRCEETDVPFSIMIDPTIMIVGEFDGIGVRVDAERKDKRVIHEIKTSSENITIGSAYWSKVVLNDPQVTTYLLASQKLGWAHTEVVYDVMLKPDLERYRATPPQARKYTKEGKLYAYQRERDETEEEFELRVLEDIDARPSHYYQRGTAVRLEHEHAAHVRDVKGTVHLLQVARKMGENVPRNTDSCFKYGRPCDFYVVCGSGADVMDPTLFQEKKPSRQRAKLEAEAPPEKPQPRFVF